MIYPDDFESRLSFDRVREWVEAKCITASAVEKLRNTTFSSDFESIERLLNETMEMKNILTMEDDFPDSGYVDMSPSLIKIRVEGAFIDTHEMAQLAKGIEVAKSLLRFFAAREQQEYPYLHSVAEGVHIVEEVSRRINSIIDKFLKIKDDASVELYTIRTTLRSKEQQIGKRLNSILKAAQSNGIVDEEAKITIRDGRAVVPVSAYNKRKIKGFVHDESATGKTVYIEPLEVVEINNEIKELEYAERREIVRILVEFSDFVRPYVGELLEVADFVSTIDFIRAKALVAISMEADMPILSKEPILDVRMGRHPVLEKSLKRDNKPIVPLNLTLNREKHILVISGPNAGGKSVCLKSVGLFQYMLQCGMLLPVSPNSTFGLFKKIFVDIGDQQSIDNDLSTYSSHLANMKSLLRWSDSDSLVLIDEFGSGTEPTMGGAIAETILQKIEERGVFGIITTHYSNIKYYAANAEGVINGAMSFDVQNIRPLFALEMGKPGSSFAFEIARKSGLPEEVVKEAQQKIGTSQINIEKQLREIARDKRYWENKRDRIRIAEKRTDELAQKYDEELSHVLEERRKLIAEAKAEAKEIVLQANKVIENTIREIKEAQAERERTKIARTKVEALKENLLSDQKDDDDGKISKKIEQLRQREQRRADRKRRGGEKKEVVIKHNAPKVRGVSVVEVGTKVKMKGQSVGGEVLKIDGKRALVAFGVLTLTVEIAKLEIIEDTQYNKESKESRSSFSSSKQGEGSYNPFEKRLEFSSQIDVRGQRVEEATRKAVELADEAIMLGISEVKILHGKGTGALKEEIRKILRVNPLVKSVRDEHEQFGGAGITVVKLDV